MSSGFGILDHCTKCGRAFLRGIYPQKTCDWCSGPGVYWDRDGRHDLSPRKQPRAKRVRSK